MANMIADIKNYDDAMDFLMEKDSLSRKVGHNTYVVSRSIDTVAIKYHDTDIVTYHRGGRITFNDGGWDSVTTRERMGQFSDIAFHRIKGVTHYTPRIYDEVGGYYRHGDVTLPFGGTLTV